MEMKCFPLVKADRGTEACVDTNTGKNAAHYAALNAKH